MLIATEGGGLKSRAFTLIELLAVIIIIGVIALITTPIIINVIGKTERGAFERSIDGLLETVRLDYSTDDFVSPREYYYEGKDLILLTVAEETKDESIGMKGKIDGKGFIYIDEEGIIHIENICSKKYCASGEENKIEITENESGIIPEVGKNDPIIRLIGEKTIYVNLNNSYEEPGVVAKTKSGKELEYTNEITLNGAVVTNIDTSVENTYVIIYKTSNDGKEVSVSRNVVVLDMKPEITITEGKETYVSKQDVLITVSAIRPNTLTSFIVEVKKDGEVISPEIIEETEISKRVILSETGIYEVIVTVTDNNNHTSTMTRNYKIDSEPPKLTVNNYNGKYGTDKALETLYKAEFGEMGGNVICKDENKIVTNIKDITVADDHTITCTAIGSNGKNSETKSLSLAFTSNHFSDVMTGSDIDTNDPDRNKRYVGPNPNNYVMFNGEKWRIIGLFGGQAKIIKSDFIGVRPWDNDSTHGENGWNDWSKATLKTYLNDDYLSKINVTQKKYIDTTHIWPIGGWNANNIIREVMYGKERGTTVYNMERPMSWQGAIGLMYPTDYHYASNGGDLCNTTIIGGWNQPNPLSECAKKSWLYDTAYEEWTITSDTSSESTVFELFPNGNVHTGVPVSYGYANVRPVLYLKSTVKIKGGTGTNEDPYILGIDFYDIDCTKKTETIMGKSVTSCIMKDDPDHNLRYVGPNPSNYVKFNNELWRIIGVFDGKTKIIRSESIGKKSWDANASNGGHGTYGYNDWETATLQLYLNKTYYPTIETTSKNYITEYLWKMGGSDMNNYLSSREAVYLHERGIEVYNGRKTEWSGKIALMYPSDYAYASSGDSICDSTGLNHWHEITTECANKSWLYMPGQLQWSLMPGSSMNAAVAYISDYVNQNPPSELYEIKPVLYLDASVKIKNGTGTISDPYILGK